MFIISIVCHIILGYFNPGTTDTKGAGNSASDAINTASQFITAFGALGLNVLQHLSNNYVYARDFIQLLVGLLIGSIWSNTMDHSSCVEVIKSAFDYIDETIQKPVIGSN